MYLTKVIPARSKTISADWCTKEWCKMNEQFRAIRSKSRKKMDHCCWCNYYFKNGEMIALAGFDNGNNVLCQTCADKLLETN